MALHRSQRSAVKAATRRAVEALPRSGETARQAAARLLDVAEPTLSRWCAEHHDDLIPLGAAMVLERESQMPVYATLFAEVTGHRLVPADAVDASAADLMAGLCRLVGSHGACVSVISDALADGKATAREAADALASLASVEAEITSMKRRLTAITSGEE